MRNRAPSGTPPERALQRRALRAGALVLLALGPAACAVAVPGQVAAADSLVLALPAPLTDGAGNADVYGENARLGAMLAQKEINDKGGVRGRPIAFRIVDDEGDKEAAIAVAEQLAASGTVAVVGHVYSGPTIGTASIYEQAEIPVVATTATSPEITALGPWIFRMASSDSANAVQLAQVARAWTAAPRCCTSTTTTVGGWRASSPTRSAAAAAR